MQTTIWKRQWRRWLMAVAISVVVSFDGSGLSRPRELFAGADTAKEAASVADAVKVLDLRTMPLPANAAPPATRQVGEINFEMKADPKTAFHLQQQQFVKLGWKELPGSTAEAAYGSGMFQKSNYVVSVMTSDAGRAEQPGMSRVAIINFGNVRLSKLPVIKGAKSLFASDATAMFVTDAKHADAVQTTRQLLLDSGWEPYGSSGQAPDAVVMTFKRNAVQIQAYVTAAPAQGGKTSISYSSRLLSADIPAPTDAEGLQYVDFQKTLRFASSGSYADIGKVYEQMLAKRGWKPTTKELIASLDQFKRPIASQIFRNAADEMMSLDLQTQDAKTHAVVKHLTAQELAALEQQVRDAEQRKLAEREARQAKQSKRAATNDDDEADSLKIPDVNKLIGDILKNPSAKDESKVKANLRKLLEIADDDDDADAARNLNSAQKKSKDKPKQGIAKLERLPNMGSVTVGDKTFKLAHAIAYEVNVDGERRTVVMLSQKPINRNKLDALLKKSGNDESYFEPQAHVRILINDEDKVVSTSLWADDVSSSGNSELKGSVLVEEGRARGTLTPAAPRKFFDRVITFELSFDVDVQPLVETLPPRSPE